MEFFSVDIGPRGSTTPAEEKAAEYVETQLRQMGFEPMRQRFAAPATFSWAYIVLFSLTPLAAALFPFRPGLAFFLALAGALGYLLDVSTFPVISKFMPKGRSLNVIAKAPARSKEKQRLLVLAHLDSSRAGLNFSPAMVPAFRRNLLTTFYSVWAVALLYGAAVFLPALPRQAVWMVSLLPVLAVTVTMGFLVHRELKGEITPGANDDASGLAVLLEAARVIARAPLHTTAVWFVATGAEESGYWGALHLIRETAPDKSKTRVINLDNLGKGRLALTTAEGVIIPLRNGGAIVEAARAVAEEKSLDLDLRPYRLLTTDATAFMARGIPAATVMAFDERGLLPNWHWKTDTADRVDEDNLVKARDLVLGIIRKLGE